MARPAYLNFPPWTGLRFLKPYLDPVSYDSTPSLEGRDNLGLTVEMITEHGGPTVTPPEPPLYQEARELAPTLVSVVSVYMCALES